MKELFLARSEWPVTGLWLGTLLIALPSSLGAQQVAPEVAEEVKRLVVMVECRTGSESLFGAGIILGGGSGTLFAATADHVVRSCRQPPGAVVVRVWSRPEAETTAVISSHVEAALDLAVLEFAAPDATLDNLPFDRLGDPGAIARGDRVFSLGWRNRTWELSVTAEPVAETRTDRVYYESNLIGPGHSGGALLDDGMLIVGMLRSDQPPQGEAISIAAIMERARSWGYQPRLVPPSVPERLSSLLVGARHLCGLDRDGVAYCWGEYSTMLGTGVLNARMQDVASRRVAGGLRFRSLTSGALGSTCGVALSGIAYCWGMTRIGSAMVLAPTPVDTMHRFQALTMGDTHTCGITTARAAYCWGENDLGQLGDGTARTSQTPVRAGPDLEFAAISAGGNHTCALTPAGTAYCWGHNINGEAGVGSSVPVRAPARVAGDLQFTAISASTTGHTCGVTIAGNAYCWGLSRSGELGGGRAEADGSGDQHTPAAVAGEHRFASITTGAWYSCALTEIGEAYCWGINDDGQLGTGTEDASQLPVRVAGDLRFSTIAAAPFYGKLTCGLTIDGIPYCWGRTDAPRQAGAEFPLDVAVRVPRRIHP